MASPAETAIAFVARRQGGATLTAAAWTHILSLELGWLTPTAAKRFVENAVAAGLLGEEDDGLAPTFDWKAVQVPRRFRLDDAEVAASPRPRDDPFVALLDEVAVVRGAGREAVLQDVAAWQERMGGDLTAEAAALLVAAQSGMDVRERARDALERLKAGSG